MRRLWCGAAAALAVIALASVVTAGEPPPGGGMRMYVDPDTGRVGVPSSAVASDGALLQAEPSGANLLTAEPVTAAPGGVKVNLRGRFQAAVTRSAGAAGVGAHECVESGAGAR